MKNKNHDKNIVFFCATAPYVMVYKIAKEFKKKGYRTTLITISQEDKFETSFYLEAFDKIICSNFQIYKPTPKNLLNMACRSPFLIKSIFEMKQIKPYVIFNISRPNYISALFMKAFREYPQIYFPSDISSQLHLTLEDALGAGKKLYEIKAERYCFENADGIFHKGAPNELEHLKSKNMLGSPLKILAPIICFNPYCSDEFIMPLNKNKLSKKDGELHLAYIGSFYNGEEDIAFYINFLKKLMEQKIHVHLYAKTHHLSKKDERRNIAPLMEHFKNNNYFHLEFAVPPKKLIAEISKYDFGSWMDVLRPEGNEHEFTIGNKFSSYLEAGIPFVYTSTLQFIGKLSKKYGIDFPLDTTNIDSLDGLGKKLMSNNYALLEKKICFARNDFNMKKNIPRLEKFIEKIVEEKKSKIK